MSQDRLLYQLRRSIHEAKDRCYFIHAHTLEEAYVIAEITFNWNRALGLSYKPITIDNDCFVGKMFAVKGSGYFDTTAMDWDSPSDLADLPYIHVNVRQHFIDIALEYLE